MRCYHPITGWRSRTLNQNGKRPVVFNPKYGYLDMEVKVPCGRCIGCRLDYSRQWAIRIVHEAQMHEESAFITLTYDEDYLPADRSVSKRELQLFFKNLRLQIDEKIRYFACGEYGKMNNRPHYHAIIFGYGFPDKTIWKVTNGVTLYRSRLLESVWRKGWSTVGEATFQSAAYVARYVTKKWRADPREEKPEVDMRNAIVNKETGEILQLEPEFALMSRGGRAKDGTNLKGIGYKWYEKYGGDTEKDFVVINGKRQSLPKYYDQLLGEKDPEKLIKVKGKRLRELNEDEQTYERRIAKEKVKTAQSKMLKRGFENDD